MRVVTVVDGGGIGLGVAVSTMRNDMPRSSGARIAPAVVVVVAATAALPVTVAAMELTMGRSDRIAIMSCMILMCSSIMMPLFLCMG